MCYSTETSSVLSYIYGIINTHIGPLMNGMYTTDIDVMILFRACPH